MPREEADRVREPLQSRKSTLRSREDRSAHETKDQRTRWADEAGERRDDDEAHEGAVHSRRKVGEGSAPEELDREERKHRGGGGDERRQYDDDRFGVELEDAPRIEPEPTHPQEKD